ncbi:helix-turn-helix domain-containing protein [Streptomyces sp. NPDC088360]|uniref:helix-turn-helix domain-containing protein n=1 Tax=Streptomyces sp. NPDC088360 TaxID=3154515 RepID=UPI00344C26A1
MLLTTGQAAEELGCAITTVRRLIKAGLLPNLSHRGNRVMIPLDTVQTLRDREAAPLELLPAGEIAVLRANVARPADDGYGWTGFAAHLHADDLLMALRGWWRCDPASVAAGGVLPVTMSGYVVAVLTGIESVDRSQGRYCFSGADLAGYVTDLALPVKRLTGRRPADRTAADLLLGTRLPSHSGGAIAYVSTRTAD